MKLSEVEVGKKIQVIVVLDEKRLEFESVIAAVVDQSVLIEPIMNDDKTVGFNNHEAAAIYIAEDNKPYAWSSIEIKLVRYQEQIYHQLVAKTQGAPFNRRRAYRQYVGMEGMVNDLHKNYKVIVKDVSIGGCSFVCNEELEIGHNVLVSFSDDKENYSIRCTIVRKYVIEENGKTVYGCASHVANRKIEHFIMEHQIIDMQRRNS